MRKVVCSSNSDSNSNSGSNTENDKHTPNLDPLHSSNLHLQPLTGKAYLKIQKAKLSARPELAKNDSWTKNKYYLNFSKLFPVDDPSVKNNIEYVDMKVTTTKQFEEKYIRDKIPCVMYNCTDHWPATKKWTTHRIGKKYRNQSMKCGESDEGHNVKLKIKYYIEYMNTTLDDSPLYIFDANYGDHCKNKRLLEDYEILEPLKDDIFNYASDKRRPPHRWFVMGPARSGTGIHIDPLGTSAWNALISGHKRWIMIPTSVDPELLKVTSNEDNQQRDEGITWFMKKRIKCLNSLPKDIVPIELIQKPGEVVFVPSGWWHAVINLDNTIAVTQNIAHREHFTVNYHKAARARPKMVKKLMETLKVERPEIFNMCKNIDLTKSSGQASSSSSDSSDSSTSSSELEDENEKYLKDSLSKRSNSSVHQKSLCASNNSISSTVVANCISGTISPAKKKMRS